MAIPCTINPKCSVLEIPNEKASYLQQLATLNAESLKLLAELSKYKDIEKKLKANAGLIKLKLAF